MNTLYVTRHRSTVRYERGTLLVSDPAAGRTRVLLSTLDALVRTGYGQITSQAIAVCVRRNVVVSALSRSGGVRFTCGGPVTGNIHLRLAQYRASQDPATVTAISRNIVAGKIQNCRRMLLRWSWDARPQAQFTLNKSAHLLAERLLNATSKTDPDALRGVEGDATRRYFQGMRAVLADTELAFSGRNRRPPRDPVSAQADSVRLYRLSRTSRESVMTSGQGSRRQLGQPWIV